MSIDFFSTAQLATSIVPVLYAIGWALIHFLWQGTLVAGVTALLLMLTSNAKAQTRYAISCIALLICALLPLWELMQTGVSSQSDATMVVARTAIEGGVSNVELSLRQQLEIWLHSHLLQMVAIWLTVVSLLMCRMLLGLWWLQSYHQGKRGVAHPALQHQLDRLSHAFALSKQVILRVVDDLESPITIGSLRPMVLVPASLVTGMSPAHLEALLAHELAHISRYDYLFNLMQHLIESFLFFHPAVWWISKKIRNERENIADDLAASVLGEPRRLALALQELDHIRFTTPQLAQAAHGGHLMSRIKRLVRPEDHSMNWKTAVTLIAATVAGFTLAANAAVPAASPQVAAPVEIA
ncbi:MAG: M56 family metallopeptidase, partial [Burkholderiales bacterium]|nr:M56 family metallopeptidase [Burkholderiales bacterium]